MRPENRILAMRATAALAVVATFGTAATAWGQNDQIFPAEGAHPYKRDLETLEFHLLDTGHFALEEDGAFIAERIRAFVGRHAA